MIVAVVAFVGFAFLRSWGADAADRMAERRVAEIRAALEGLDPESLALDPLAFNEGAEVPGGPYRLAFVGPDGFEATDEVHSRLQYRCIHVLLAEGGQVAIDVDDGRC